MKLIFRIIKHVIECITSDNKSNGGSMQRLHHRKRYQEDMGLSLPRDQWKNTRCSWFIPRVRLSFPGTKTVQIIYLRCVFLLLCFWLQCTLYQCTYVQCTIYIICSFVHMYNTQWAQFTMNQCTMYNLHIMYFCIVNNM